MRLFLFVGAAIGLIGCSAAQEIPVSEGQRYPCAKKVWKDDGYQANPGKIFVKNQYYDEELCANSHNTKSDVGVNSQASKFSEENTQNAYETRTDDFEDYDDKGASSSRFDDGGRPSPAKGQDTQINIQTQGK